MKILTLILFILAGFAAVEAQVTSIYTKLTDKACKPIEVNDDEGGSYHGRCPGVGKYKLDLTEGDLRQSITVVDPKGKEHPLKFWHLTAAFNAVDQTAEWRMRRRKPIALIVRLNVNENPEKIEQRRSYLVVAKITDDEICVTDYLPPTRSQNLEARKAADKAATKLCRITEPE